MRKVVVSEFVSQVGLLAEALRNAGFVPTPDRR